MSNEKKRVYVGKGVKAGQFDLTNISVCIDTCEPHIFEYNGKRYIKLTVGGLRETDQYGKTHSVWVNDYKPEQKQEQKQSAPVNTNSNGVPDLPF
jgi:hypothetical protein